MFSLNITHHKSYDSTHFDKHKSVTGCPETIHNKTNKSGHVGTREKQNSI